MNRLLLFVALICALMGLSGSGDCESLASARDVSTPVPGKVTMVDLGSEKCPPCMKMAPTLKELQEEFRGKAVITFIDIWENPAAGIKFDINTLPTQIFFDRDGREICRHEGYLDKPGIVTHLKEAGLN